MKIKKLDEFTDVVWVLLYDEERIMSRSIEGDSSPTVSCPRVMTSLLNFVRGLGHHLEIFVPPSHSGQRAYHMITSFPPTLRLIHTFSSDKIREILRTKSLDRS